MAQRVVELFAGVGGFRLALERAGGWDTVWSNQWEPGRKTQHASTCYVSHFGPDGHVNDDIGEVDKRSLPDHDLLVGGFPCQDYSVATTQAQGLHGKKGVLWWDIRDTIKAKRPTFVLLENVDRLLKSPTSQRGRDFAIILWCLNNLGYAVEWRVINAADYGFPQRRRRVFIFAVRQGHPFATGLSDETDKLAWLRERSFFAKPFPVAPPKDALLVPPTPRVRLPKGLQETSDKFDTPFENAGVMLGGAVWMEKLKPDGSNEKPTLLRDVIEAGAPEKYYLAEDAIDTWRYLKGSKREPRKAKNGFTYTYNEGALPFPDPLDRPARTVLTNEGGPSPSRFKHVIQDPSNGRLRRLTPREVERLNGFDDDWTASLPEGWRYFTMGNALAVGLIERMGRRLNGIIGTPLTPNAAPRARVKGTTNASKKRRRA